MLITFKQKLTQSLSRGFQALTNRQHPSGYWEGRLASSPLATAVALCATLNDQHSTIQYQPAFEYLRKTQNSDGGWGDTDISKSNLAASLLVLCADAISKQDTPENLSPLLSSDALQKAQSYCNQKGGLAKGLRNVYGKDLTFQVPIRVTASFAGIHDWRQVEALPLELALIPHAIMGAVGLPVVSYALPALVCMGLARHSQAPSLILPLRWFRAAASERALNRILKMQPESGGYLEAIPITAFCLLGLKASHRADHPIAQNAKRFLQETQRTDGSWPVEVNLSLWNTTRVIEALDAGHMLNTPAFKAPCQKSKEWLLQQQTKTLHPYTNSKPGGWGWNHLPGSVPDADDTSGAILALKSLGLEDTHEGLQKGRTWLLGLQNSDGGWPTFCKGWQKLPFDQSAPDLTAHALRALDALAPTEDKKAASARQRGWGYLKKKQTPAGSFKPLWFGCESAQDELNETYGTTHVLFACSPDQPESNDIKEKALEWLRSIQNTDGGFGGCVEAPSTAEETGLALRALILHKTAPDDAVVRRAADWLIEKQNEDGTWPHAPIGFYFAVLWYHEEMYPLAYALGGLGAMARNDAGGDGGK